MAHKVTIDATDYEIKSGRTLVDGTGYDVNNGKSLIDGTGYDIDFSSYDPVFANNEWSAIIQACQNNEVPETWLVGANKLMLINGVNYQIDIIGKYHDTYTDGGTAPLTLQMHNCYGTKYPMRTSYTNSGGWESCAMRSTSLPDILALMPSEVRTGIKEVSKLTSAVAQSATINTTADKLFLLSEVEIFGSVVIAKSVEGTQYAYYAAGNSKVKYFGDGASTWWERSPSGSNSTYFCRVTATGSAASINASYQYGVSFGFCF